MKKVLYIVALLLAICWAIGFFGFDFGAAIHVLLVISIVIVVMKVLGDKNATEKGIE